jgi:TM2 domain-containing membrane protein YozV
LINTDQSGELPGPGLRGDRRSCGLLARGEQLDRGFSTVMGADIPIVSVKINRLSVRPILAAFRGGLQTPSRGVHSSGRSDYRNRYYMSPYRYFKLYRPPPRRCNLCWNVIKFDRCPYCKHDNTVHKKRSKLTLVVLALTLGSIGAHHMYLGRWNRALLHIALCPLMFPSYLLALVDAVHYLFMSDKAMDVLLSKK